MSFNICQTRSCTYLRAKQYGVVRLIIGLVIVSLFLFELSGCRKQMAFSIVDLSDPAHPIFKLAEKGFLRAQGIDVTYFDISYLDKTTNRIARAWSIQNISNTELSLLEYGEVPNGFVEDIKSVPLQVNVCYSVNGGEFLFKIISPRDNVYTSIVCDYSNYGDCL